MRAIADKVGEPQYPRFSEKEYNRRRKSVKDLMKSKGVDSLLIYGTNSAVPNVHYLSNYVSWAPTYLIFPLHGEPTLVLYFYNHIPCAREMSIIKNVTWQKNDPVTGVCDELRKKRLDKSTIGVIGLSTIPFSDFEGIRRQLRLARFIDLAAEYSSIRWIRSDEEIEWFKKSAEMTDSTCQILEKRIRSGLSEHDLFSMVGETFLKKGGQARGPFITSTNMKRPDIFVPWQYPRARKLSRGDVVITEITVSYYGYGAQIHRPFAVEQEPNRLFSRLYDAALDCFSNVAKALRPGATSFDLIRAMSIIEERGFTTYDSLVHGEAGKGPELGSSSSVYPEVPFTFKENMVVVIQPQPISKKMGAGLQLGAATVVKPGGSKNLHMYPFKFPVCGG